ncbi:F-box only protein 48 [Protopterus annectens]|uniref:F-box only protein 48 n=1 Tax=Protopterus annectens TaxID=7888 RepID=UPI001CFA8C86|nr:F-box only protein 48 [Protopterus annectens]
MFLQRLVLPAMQKTFKRSKVTSILLENDILFSPLKETKKENLDFVEVFPPEISLKIFSDLDIKSLCTAALVCKTWNYVINNSDSLWRKHCLIVRAICQKEVDDDRGTGYSWKVTLQRNYWKRGIKEGWLNGLYSNINSAAEMPENHIYPMDVDTWGEILEAELER